MYIDTIDHKEEDDEENKSIGGIGQIQKSANFSLHQPYGDFQFCFLI